MAEPPADLPGHNFFETITVCAGDGDEEKKDFVIHKSFAAQSSKFLRAALDGDWKEAREKRIPLPEAKVADFQVYTEWLYTGCIVGLDKDMTGARGATLVRLHILGDFLGDNLFSNTIIDNLILSIHSSGSSMSFRRDTVDMAWDKTMPGSPLRKVLIQFIICSVGGCHISPRFDDVGLWSKEVSVEVFMQTNVTFTNMTKAAPGAKSLRSESTLRTFKETIVVSVGEGDDKEDFIVHRSFATKSSKFLQAALSHDGGWKEAQEKRVPLPETKPVDFEVYLEWLYTNQLTSREVETRHERGAMLIRLYILGDFLDDAGFCNKVMDILTPGVNDPRAPAWTAWSLNHEDFSLSWAKTPVGSSLRTFLLEFIAYHISHIDGCYQTFLESDVPKEMLLELFQHLESEHGLMKLLKPSTKLSKLKRKCAFHRHEEENPECSESQ